MSPTPRNSPERRQTGVAPDRLAANGVHYGKRGVDLADKRKPEKQPTVELVSAAAIEPEPVDWLWDGWLAKGKLQVLAGIPGPGKTTLALALRARSRLSAACGLTGSAEATCGRCRHVWSGEEDDPKDTLVPRRTVSRRQTALASIL